VNAVFPAAVRRDIDKDQARGCESNAEERKNAWKAAAAASPCRPDARCRARRLIRVARLK
jgi:hypothetical protein